MTRKTTIYFRNETQDSFPLSRIMDQRCVEGVFKIILDDGSSFVFPLDTIKLIYIDPEEKVLDQAPVDLPGRCM